MWPLLRLVCDASSIHAHRDYGLDLGFSGPGLSPKVSGLRQLRMTFECPCAASSDCGDHLHVSSSPNEQGSKQSCELGWLTPLAGSWDVAVAYDSTCSPTSWSYIGCLKHNKCGRKPSYQLSPHLQAYTTSTHLPANRVISSWRHVTLPHMKTAATSGQRHHFSVQTAKACQ